MSTELESRIHDAIEDHVRAAHPHAPDVEALLRRARRARRGRLAGSTAGAVAAVLAALLVVANISGPSGVPTPGSRAPRSGGAAGLPQAVDGARGPAAVAAPRRVFLTADGVWMDGRRLAVDLPFEDGSEVDLDGPDPLSFPATSSSVHIARDGLAYPGADNRPTLLRRDGDVQLLAPAAPTLPGAVYDDWVAADPSGPLVAWDEYDGSTVRVTAYDTVARKVVGTRTLACDDSFAGGCQRPYVVSDGLVFIAGTTMQVWDPAAGTVRAIGGFVQQARNRVIQAGAQDGGDLDPSAVGAGWAVASELQGVEGNLSFDGAWLLDNGGRDSRVLNWREPSQVIRYDLPPEAEQAVFDTDGSILVVSHTEGRFTGWDCSLSKGCRVVVPSQAGEIRLVGWDT